MNLGIRLRKARQGAGYTLRQLATALGIAHSTLGHWENNRSIPDAVRLFRIAQLTGVDATLLLTGQAGQYEEPSPHPREDSARASAG